MTGSYVSTGAGGTDYEVDVAAASLARLLTETADRVLPAGFTPKLVGLQDRTGPAGFDDAMIIAVDKSGDELKVFIQAKRHFSFAASGDFPAFVQAIAAHDQTNQGSWLAALVAGETTLPLEDVQTLLESARLSPDSGAFRTRWDQPGTTNRPKRDFLSAVRAVLADDDEAVWRMMRRLVVLDYDYHLVHSRDRDAALAALDAQLTGASQDAATLFGGLRGCRSTARPARGPVDPTFAHRRTWRHDVAVAARTRRSSRSRRRQRRGPE
jgi:nitroreductase